MRMRLRGDCAWGALGSFSSSFEKSKTIETPAINVKKNGAKGALVLDDSNEAVKRNGCCHIIIHVGHDRSPNMYLQWGESKENRK